MSNNKNKNITKKKINKVDSSTKQNKNVVKKSNKTEKNIYLLFIAIILVMTTIFNLVISVLSFSEKPLYIEKETVKYIMDENIVFFGDSITEGYNLGKYYPNKNVINSGIGGNLTSQLVDRVSKDVYKYNPSKIFILIGINDLSSNVPQDEIINNIQKLINDIKINRKLAKIYVESIYPINRDSFNKASYKYNEKVTNDVIKNVNKRIKEVCEESNVTYVDVFNALIDEKGNLKESYTTEGLHISANGYYQITKVLEKYIMD